MKQAESDEWAEPATRSRRSREAHAVTDPRPCKEDEDDHDGNSGRLHDLSFIGPAGQGGAPPRSDASSPESGAPLWNRLAPNPTI